MIALEIFRGEELTELDLVITEYVNGNISMMISVLIDYLNNNSDFSSIDFLPKNNFRIEEDVWVSWVNDLYEIVDSRTMRIYITPNYEFLLYAIIKWWNDCEEDANALLNVLGQNFIEQIQEAYTEEGGSNHILHMITDVNQYENILFGDYDFLPENITLLTMEYLENPQLFEMLYSDVDLLDYRYFMAQDVKKQFDDYKSSVLLTKNKEPFEDTLFRDILDCCKQLQSNAVYRNFSENEMNDVVRDALENKGYDVKDQTRKGKSATGKGAGLVDILVKAENKSCFIVEALKLNSVNKSYISEHIDKIYKYDPLGNRCNFMIAYVNVGDFGKFWKKYI